MDTKDIVIAAGAIVSVAYGIIRAIGWSSRRYGNKSDTEKIINFLSHSEEEGTWKWRTTRAISKATDISPDRVVELCSQDKRIEISGKKEEVWRLRN